MVIFTKNWLSGLERDQSNSWENLLLNWVENNWTLTSPGKYHPVTEKHGVLFGSEYYGQWDLVLFAIVRDGKGLSSNLLSAGGRFEENTVDINLIFCVRKYSVQGGDEIPVEVTYVAAFLEELIDKNPRGLQSEGIRYMMLQDSFHGEKEYYGQQIFEMNFTIRCIISRINLE